MCCAAGCLLDPTHLDLKSLELMSRQSLRRAQEDNEAIGPAIQAAKLGHWPEISTNPGLLRLKREAGKLSMKDWLLYCNSRKRSGEVVSQLAFPRELCKMVLRAMHDGLGHLGQERTVNLRSRFFWPKMALNVEEYVRN